jgi:hypothetical protein
LSPVQRDELQKNTSLGYVRDDEKEMICVMMSYEMYCDDEAYEMFDDEAHEMYDDDKLYDV